MILHSSKQIFMLSHILATMIQRSKSHQNTIRMLWWMPSASTIKKKREESKCLKEYVTLWVQAIHQCRILPVPVLNQKVQPLSTFLSFEVLQVFCKCQYICKYWWKWTYNIWKCRFHTFDFHSRKCMLNHSKVIQSSWLLKRSQRRASTMVITSCLRWQSYHWLHHFCLSVYEYW